MPFFDKYFSQFEKEGILESRFSENSDFSNGKSEKLLYFFQIDCMDSITKEISESYEDWENQIQKKSRRAKG